MTWFLKYVCMKLLWYRFCTCALSSDMISASFTCFFVLHVAILHRFSNGKMKLSLSAPWRHVRGKEVLFHSLLTSLLDGGEESVSRPSRFIRRERIIDAHWIGVCVGSRKSLNVLNEKNILCPPSNELSIVHATPWALWRSDWRRSIQV
jgi:hypothetical protein